MCESTTRVQGAIDCFSVELKKDREFMKLPVLLRQDNEDGREILSDLGTWMAEQVVEAQQTNLEASKVILNQYTTGWDSRLM